MTGSVKKILAHWRTLPVILASTSDYRRKELERCGFTRVVPHAIPDEVEQQAKATWEDREHGGFYDPYCMNFAELVAHEKVRYVREHGSVPADAIICAADTMPMVFHHRRAEEFIQGRLVWRSEHLHKPASEPAAHALAIHTLTAVAKGYRAKQELMAQLPFQDEESLRIMRWSQRMGNLPMRIQVNTGFAVALPGKDIIGTSSAAVLFPEAVYGLLGPWDPSVGRGQDPVISEEEAQKIATLGMRIVERTYHEGIDPCRVSGGVNWASRAVRKLVGATPMNYPHQNTPEQGTYLGFPRRTFRSFLRAYATACAADKPFEELPAFVYST